jgi:hypothetical protein
MATCRRCGTAVDEDGRCPECDDPRWSGSEDDAQELVSVMRTADGNLLPVVKSVLEAAGIPFVVQGDASMGMIPLGPFGGGMFRDVLGASVLVPRGRAEEASELLRTFDPPTEES